MPHLVVESGNRRGTRIEMRPGDSIEVGRDATAELSLDDQICSRRHFRITVTEREAVLEDLASSNGTFVNEARTDRHALAHGDSIRLGETTLTWLDEEPAQAASRGLVGKTLGGYRILERIGRGGMGTVFKAVQTSLDRVVALKILSPKIAADPTFVVKFQREARAAGQLNHPNIVQVYDVGSDVVADRELHFYSMEYIENGSVQDLATREGTLDPELALSVVIDAARGLEYAEKRGLVHRDIKPDNLMINSEGVVKIADLGLARDTGSGRDADGNEIEGQAHDDDEGIFGTPHFISPEQAQGKETDTRSDMYSLGASLYRLLTGSTPFSGDSVREIIHAQIQDDPQPIRERVKGVPAPLAAITERLMRKDPNDRPASAAELVTELEKMREGVEGKGSKGLWIALGGGAIAAAGLAVFLLGGDKEPEPDPDGPSDGGATLVAPPAGASDEERAAFERLERTNAAILALSNLRDDLRSNPPASLEEQRAAVARFEAFLQEHQDVDEKTLEEARGDRSALQKAIATAEEAAEEEAAAEGRRAEAAAERLAAIFKEVDAAVARQREGEALQLLVRGEIAPALEGREEVAKLRERFGNILAQSRTLAGEATRSAATAFAGGQLERGREALKTARGRLLEGVIDANTKLDPLRTLGEELDAALNQAEELERNTRLEGLRADQVRALQARRQAALDLRSALAPAAASKALKSARAATEAIFWQKLLDEDLARLQRVEDFLAAYGAAARDNQLTDSSMERPSSAGSSRMVSWRIGDADASSITLERSGGRARETIALAELTTLAFHDQFLTGRLPEGLREGAAELLLAAALPARAQALLAGGGSAPGSLASESAAAELAGRLQRLEAAVADDPSLWPAIASVGAELLAQHTNTLIFALLTDGTEPIGPLKDLVKAPK